ncbi:MAG TPA: DUF6285 domain-containing protein [Polyangia bacterium]|nr:DUF6285 domain-containing protein [Polyangia bacterium]
MIDPPDKATLLDAVALFLVGELKGAVADPKLGFRVLIAAHLTASVAAELRGDDAQDAAELERLRALLPDVATQQNDPAERRAELARLNGELAKRLRGGALDGDAWRAAFDHLQATLAEKLRVVSPRFELKPDIE